MAESISDCNVRSMAAGRFIIPSHQSKLKAVHINDFFNRKDIVYNMQYLSDEKMDALKMMADIGSKCFHNSDTHNVNWMV